MRSQSKNKVPLNKARSTSKIKVPQRGYYYSSNNPRRTKTKTENKTEEDFLPTPIKLKWDNDLELYSKNTKLINWFDKETSKYSYLLNIFKEINKTISDIILKPKIKIYEIDKKKQNERLKKEKEEYEFQKNIANKIDSALQKANMALENIKQFGKLKKAVTENNILPPPIIPDINNIPLKQPKEKNEISDIIEKCQDKYVTTIEINKKNKNALDSTMTNNRNLFKIAKEKNRRLKQKHKNFGNVFDNIYNNNSNNLKIAKKQNDRMEIDEEETVKDELTEENIMLKITSLLTSSLFTKLYIKVLYDDLNQKEDNSRKQNEEIIYNAFSLWFLIHYMNNLIESYNNQNDILLKENLTDIFKQKNNFDNYFNNSEQIFINKQIINVIQNFLDNLNKTEKNQNFLENGKINENDIFPGEFYKLYQNLSKIEKIKCINYISNNIDNHENQNENIFSSKEELNLFKNIQSIFKNNGSYCCTICKK